MNVLKGMPALAVVLLGSVALAQPERGGPPDENRRQMRERIAERLQESGADRAVMKRRLREEVERTKRTQERMERAIAELDEGAEPREVVRMLRETREERPWSREVSDDDRARALGFLREHAPQMAERLGAVIESGGAMGDRMVARIASELREVDHARARDPEIGAARERALVTGLALRMTHERYRESKRRGDEEAAEKARAELRDLIGTQFDLEARMRGFEIERLRDRVERLQTELDEHAAKRDDVIDKHLERLVRGGPPDDGERRERRERKPESP